MSNMSSEQRRRLREMAASMQAPPTRPRDDYRAFDEEERRFSGRDQSTSFAAGPFRPRQYIPEHSATLSHPAGPAYPPMHRGYEVSFYFIFILWFKISFYRFSYACSITTRERVRMVERSMGGHPSVRFFHHTAGGRAQLPPPLAPVCLPTGKLTGT